MERDLNILRMYEYCVKSICKVNNSNNHSNIVQGPPNTFFFLENALKKLLKYFLKFLLLFESTILPVNNEK